MTKSVTVRIFSGDQLRFELRNGKLIEKKLVASFYSVYDLKSIWPEFHLEASKISEKYSSRSDFSLRERDEILASFADIGYHIVNILFSKKCQADIQGFLVNLNGIPMRVIGDNYRWVPWEILQFRSPDQTTRQKPVYEDFLGYGRNIYRLTPENNKPVKLSSRPNLGFLTFKGWSSDSIIKQTSDMEENAFEDLKAKGKLIWDNHIISSDSLQRDADFSLLREYLNQKDIIHFGGIIIPVLEETFLLIDKKCWMSLEDFSQPPLKGPLHFNLSPMVFLNGRDNYMRNPFHILKYVKLFQNLKASGIIASEFPIPHVTAAKFSEQFYSNLFRSKRFVGEALAETKRYFLDKHNNPFALLYVPYMDPSFQLGNSPARLSNPPTPSGPRLPKAPDDKRTPGERNPFMYRALSDIDRKKLADELKELPAWTGGGSAGKIQILRACGLPGNYVDQMTWRGNSFIDTQQVISTLETGGHFVAKPSHRNLGMLVEYVLKETIHAEGKLFLAYLIEQYHLITDLSYLEDLRRTYGLLVTPPPGLPLNLDWERDAPSFEWKASQGTQALERIWSSRAPFHDAVFLEQGSRAARAVCLIESIGSGDPRQRAWGTGFLIGPRLVLTNDHVVPAGRFADMQVRFGYRYDEQGQSQIGQTYRVIAEHERNDQDDLDFVVLELDGSPTTDLAMSPLRINANSLQIDAPVFIIQHPNGEPQKVVLQDNWTTYVDPNYRRVQYMTNTERGSSGSPVFNERWEVVALHHSGSPHPALPSTAHIRGNEGIPMRAIMPIIDHLLSD
jgi:V8-like Glu-specific endopeptidase